MSVQAIELINFKTSEDLRGSLTAVETGSCVPFEIARIFYMYNVPPGVDRGGHAHKFTKQVLIAVHGSIDIMCSDGTHDRLIELNSPSQGFLLPEMTWTRLLNFSENAVCLVLADTKYTMAHSIRDWVEYLDYLDLKPRKEPVSVVASALDE